MALTSGSPPRSGCAVRASFRKALGSDSWEGHAYGFLTVSCSPAATDKSSRAAGEDGRDGPTQVSAKATNDILPATMGKSSVRAHRQECSGGGASTSDDRRLLFAIRRHVWHTPGCFRRALVISKGVASGPTPRAWQLFGCRFLALGRNSHSARTWHQLCTPPWQHTTASHNRERPAELADRSSVALRVALPRDGPLTLALYGVHAYTRTRRIHGLRL